MLSIYPEPHIALYFLRTLLWSPPQSRKVAALTSPDLQMMIREVK